MFYKNILKIPEKVVVLKDHFEVNGCIKITDVKKDLVLFDLVVVDRIIEDLIDCIVTKVTDIMGNFNLVKKTTFDPVEIKNSKINEDFEKIFEEEIVLEMIVILFSIVVVVLNTVEH